MKNHEIVTEDAVINYGFINLPNMGFYIDSLVDIDENRFVSEMKQLCLKSKILSDTIKNGKLEFRNEEFNSGICKRILSVNKN